VNVLKVVDLRVIAANNIPPGLNSTLFTGPQSVYGSPLTWDYILTNADLSTFDLQHSSVISTNNNFLTSSLKASASTVVFSVSTVSSLLHTDYTILNTNYVGNITSYITNLSNNYSTICNIRTSTIKNLSTGLLPTTSTSIGSVLGAFATNASTTFLNTTILNSTLSFFQSVSSLISKQTISTDAYSTVLTSTLLAGWNSTLLSESNQFIGQSNSEALNKLLFTSLFYGLNTDPVTNPLLNSFSTLLGNETQIQVTLLNTQMSTLQSNFNKELSSMSSFTNKVLPDAIDAAFISLNSTNTSAFIGYSTSIGSAQANADNAYSTVTRCNVLISTSLHDMIDVQNTHLADLSTQINTTLLYRPQTFFGVDIFANNSNVSSIFYREPTDYTSLQNDLNKLLSTTFSTNAVYLSTLYKNQLCNAYYDILVQVRKSFNTSFTEADFSTLNGQIYQYLNFQSTLNNGDIKNFLNTPYYNLLLHLDSNSVNQISTKQGAYYTLLNSTLWQNYTGVIISEQLAICNSQITIGSSDSVTQRVSSFVELFYLSSLSPTITWSNASFTPINPNVTLSTFSTIYYFSTNYGLVISTVPFYSSGLTQNLSSLSTLYYFQQVFNANTTNTFINQVFSNLNNQFSSNTSTTKLNLITYTFNDYRSNSEQVLRGLNAGEAYQSTSAGLNSNSIINGPFGDVYYSNLSTITEGNFLSTTTIMQSTQKGIFDSSTVSINFIYYFRNLSTNYISSMSVANSYYSTFYSSLQETYRFESALQTTNYAIHNSTNVGNYFNSDSTIMSIYQDRDMYLNTQFSTNALLLSTTYGFSLSTLQIVFLSSFANNRSNFSTQKSWLLANFSSALGQGSTNANYATSSVTAYNNFTLQTQNSNFSVGTFNLSTNYLNSNSTLSSVYNTTYFAGVTVAGSSLSTAVSSFTAALSILFGNQYSIGELVSSTHAYASNTVSTIFYSSMYITSTNYSTFYSYGGHNQSTGLGRVSSSLNYYSTALYGSFNSSISTYLTIADSNTDLVSSLYVSSISLIADLFSTSRNQLLSDYSTNVYAFSTLYSTNIYLLSSLYVSSMSSSAGLYSTGKDQLLSDYSTNVYAFSTLYSTNIFLVSSLYVSSVSSIGGLFSTSCNDLVTSYSASVYAFSTLYSTDTYLLSTLYVSSISSLNNIFSTNCNLLISSYSSSVYTFSTLYSTDTYFLSSLYVSSISSLAGLFSTNRNEILSSYSASIYEFSTLYSTDIYLLSSLYVSSISSVAGLFSTNCNEVVSTYSASIYAFSTLYSTNIYQASTQYVSTLYNISSILSSATNENKSTFSSFYNTLLTINSTYYLLFSSLYVSTFFSTISTNYIANITAFVANYSSAIQTYSTFIGIELSTNTYNLSTAVSTISTIYYSNYLIMRDTYSTTIIDASNFYAPTLSVGNSYYSTALELISSLKDPNVSSSGLVYSNSLQNLSTLVLYYSTLDGLCNVESVSTLSSLFLTASNAASTLIRSSNSSLIGFYTKSLTNYNTFYSTAFSTLSTVYTINQSTTISLYSTVTIDNSTNVGIAYTSNVNNLSTAVSTVSSIYLSSILDLSFTYSSYFVNYSNMAGVNLSTNLCNLSTAVSTISTIYVSSLNYLYLNYSSYIQNFSGQTSLNLSTDTVNAVNSLSTLSSFYTTFLFSTINYYSTSMNQFSTLIGTDVQINTTNYSTVTPRISTIFASSYSSIALFYSTQINRFSTVFDRSNSTLDALSNRYDSTFSSYFTYQYSSLLGNYSANIILLSTLTPLNIILTQQNYSTAVSNTSTSYFTSYLDLKNMYSTASSNISTSYIVYQSTFTNQYSTNYTIISTNYDFQTSTGYGLYSTNLNTVSTIFATQYPQIFLNYSTLLSNSSTTTLSSISVLTINYQQGVSTLLPVVANNVVSLNAAIVLSTFFSAFPSTTFGEVNSTATQYENFFLASTVFFGPSIYSTQSTNYRFIVSSISTDFGKFLLGFSSAIIPFSTGYLTQVGQYTTYSTSKISTLANKIFFQQLTATSNNVIYNFKNNASTLSTVYGYGLTQTNNISLSNNIQTSQNVFNYGNSTNLEQINITETTFNESPFKISLHNRVGLQSLIYLNSTNNQVTTARIIYNGSNSTTSQIFLSTITPTFVSTVFYQSVSTISTLQTFVSTVFLSGITQQYYQSSFAWSTLPSTVVFTSTVNFFSTLITPLNTFYSIISTNFTFSSLSTINVAQLYVSTPFISTLMSTNVSTFLNVTQSLFSTAQITSTFSLPGFQSTIKTYQNQLGNTMSTFYLDLFMYQNFYVNVNTMSNANPTIETYVSVCNLPTNVQSGEIFVNIRNASQNELVAKRFISFINVVSTLRKNITNSVGLLKVKYTSINGQTMLTSIQNFSETPTYIGANIQASVPSQTVLTINTGNIFNYWVNAANQPAGYTFPIAIQSNLNTGIGDYSLSGIVVDSLFNLYVTDINSNMIWVLSNGSNTLYPYVSSLVDVYTLTIDSNGNLYAPSYTGNKVYKIATNKTVTTLTTSIQNPLGITIDSSNKNLFVASAYNHNIYTINLTTNQTSFFMGGSNTSPAYADGNATTVRFGGIFGMAADTQGNLYVADFDTNTIRSIKISISSSVKIAGTANTSGSTDGINAAALFNSPRGLVTDNQGNLYINDYMNYAFRTLSLQNNQVSTIAGNAHIRGVQDGYLSTATFAQPFGLAIDTTATNFYLTDIQSVRRINFDAANFTGVSASNVLVLGSNEASTRYVITLAGSYTPNFPAHLYGLAYDGVNFYLGATSNSGNSILIYNQTGGLLSTFVTLPTQPYNIVADKNSNLIVTDNLNTIYWVSNSPIGFAQAPVVVTNSLTNPQGITIDRYQSTNIYFTTRGKIQTLGLTAGVPDSSKIVTLAGNTSLGSNDGTGTAATFSCNIPGIAAWDGIVYISDQGNSIIRQIDATTGITKLIAGAAGSPGFANGIGIAAQFSNAQGVAAFLNFSTGVDVYVADSGNSIIRKVNPKTGVVLTIAGNDLLTGNVDGYAVNSYFTSPTSIIADTPKNLFMIDNYIEKNILMASSNITIVDNSATTNGSLINDYGGNSLANLQDRTYSNYYNRIFQSYNTTGGYQYSYRFTISFQPTVTFSYTGGMQTWTCPVGVTSIDITVTGAGGGGGYWVSPVGYGGAGGYVSGRLTVTPGTTYYIIVGGGGGGATNTSQGFGGYYGGGNGASGYYPGGGGGGFSGMFTSSTPSQGSALIIAGGGGGNAGGSGINGGAGGGLIGQSSTNPGGGGTQSGGGTGGIYGNGGTAMQGDNATGYYAGGGGGGYYGGGAGAGGGGGSGYESGAVSFINEITGGGGAGGQGNNPGSAGQNGSIVITYITAGGENITGVTIYSAPIGDTAHLPTSITAFDPNGGVLGSVSFPSWSIDKIRGLQYYVLNLTTALTSGNMTLVFGKNTLYQMYLSQLLFYATGSSTSELRAAYYNDTYAGAPVYNSLSTLLIQMRSLSTLSYISFSTNTVNSTIASRVYCNATTGYLSTYNAALITSNAGYSALKNTYVAVAASQYATSQIYDVSMNLLVPVIQTDFSQITNENLTTYILTSTSFSSLIHTGPTTPFSQLNSIFQVVNNNYITINSLTSTNINLYSNQISSYLSLEANYSTAINSYLTTASNAATSAIFAASMAQSGAANICNYFYTGNDQVFIVPAGVRTLYLMMTGASGSYGGGGTTIAQSLNTQGGFVSGNLVVNPGDTYILCVGGQTNNYSWQYGGGGAGQSPYGGSGGGRTSIQYWSGTSQYQQYLDIVTAGGGGGDGLLNPGGWGGGFIGQSGTYATGGTQSAGGSAGAAQNGYTGCNGGTYNPNIYYSAYYTQFYPQYVGGQGVLYGGGGGGGYWGGGGGLNYGSGGGGSSYVGNLTGVVVNTIGGGASNQQSGYISIIYNLVTGSAGFSNLTFKGSNQNITSNESYVKYQTNYNGSASSGFTTAINWNQNPNVTVFVSVQQWAPASGNVIGSDPPSLTITGYLGVVVPSLKQNTVSVDYAEENQDGPLSALKLPTSNTGTGCASGSGSTTGSGTSSGTGSGTSSGTGIAYSNSTILLAYTPASYSSGFYSTSFLLNSNFNSLYFNTSDPGTNGQSVTYSIALKTVVDTSATIGSGQTTTAFIPKQLMNTATKSYTSSGTYASANSVTISFASDTYIIDTNGGSFGTYGTYYTITGISIANDTQSAYTSNVGTKSVTISLASTPAVNTQCTAAVTVSGLYDKHDGAGLTNSYSFLVNMSYTFTVTAFYGFNASSRSYSATPTASPNFADSVNVATQSYYYYTGSSTSAISAGNITITNVSVSGTGFTSSGSTISFAASSIGVYTGSATITGTFKNPDGTTPTPNTISFTLSLSETCYRNYSINTTGPSYTNSPSQNGSSFSDSITVQNQAWFAYTSGNGTIPTYTVTSISLDGSAATNGYTTNGTSLISFSKSSTGTFTATATIGGTYDRQDGNGNTTSFSGLTVSLSETCAASAKSIYTNSQSESASGTIPLTLDIFNANHFKYTDGSAISQYTISTISFSGSYTGNFDWYVSPPIYPTTNSGIVTYIWNNRQQGSQTASNPPTNVGLVRLAIGSSGITYTATATISGTYNNSLGTFVNFSGLQISLSGVDPGGGGGGGSPGA
jgi:hypothetical protein